LITARFYLLDGETNASSRHRALQYFPYLRRHGIEPSASRPVPERIYQRLMEGGGTQAQKAAFYALFLAMRVRDVARADRSDVVVIQRDLFPFGPPILERLLVGRNARLVYDTDDATFLRPVFTPNTVFQRFRSFDKVKEVVSRARWVSVATEPIAAWARQHNPNVSVVPMALDLAEYDRVGRNDSLPGRVVVGWAGTAGGLGYLHALAPILRDIAAKHPLRLMVISGGYRQVCVPGVAVEAGPWSAATALTDMAQFDIGLVPLGNTPFENAKFPFKLLQYLALGIPAVCARVGVASTVIRHGENGLLAGSLEEWRDGLEMLIGDAELRRRLGTAGRETVQQSYTLERIAPLLVQGLSDAAT
jgi:glycosyltransferase involved in cell wall biosynthesis